MNQTNSTEHKKVKNPNWQEANKVAIYKRDQGFVIASWCHLFFLSKTDLRKTDLMLVGPRSK